MNGAGIAWIIVGPVHDFARSSDTIPRLMHTLRAPMT